MSGEMAQPTKPGNPERGWNDPPVLLHGSDLTKPPLNQGQSPAKRTLLNKRVAHPGIFSGGGTGCPNTGDGAQPKMTNSQTVPPSLTTAPPFTSSGSHPCTNTHNTVSPAQAVPSPPCLAGMPHLDSPPVNGVILLPPALSTDIPRFTAPIIVPTMSPKEDSPLSQCVVATNPVTNLPVNTEVTNNDTPIPDFDNDEQMYHFIITRLRKTCLSCAETVQAKVIDDINRKLDIFSNMWKDGKISYPVKSSMARLATALHHRKCDIAHQIHLALMMDYVSEVSQWMVGIKRLIQEARATEAPLSPTDNTLSGVFGTDTTSAADKHAQNTADVSCIKNTADNTQIKKQEQSADSITEDSTDQTDLQRQSDSPATIEATMID